MMEKLRVVFFGTPQFAVESLEKLIDAGINVVAVVTAPDKPGGRGMQLQASAVKQCALKHQIPVFQPTNLKSDQFIEHLRQVEANLQVVIAFRMLPEVVWNMPVLGTINLHASLLPDYRGAAPINWAIINGEKETGVSTFLLQHEIDTGDIIFQQKVPIHDEMNAGALHDELMHIGANLTLKTVLAIAEKSYQPIKQSSGSTKHAPKIFTPDCIINWEKTGPEIHNLIRGLAPYPGAITYIGNTLLKIYKSHFEPDQHQKKVGFLETVTGKTTYMRFATSDGWIYADEVQLEGKKKMLVADLLRGWQPVI
jgi:methionyl-tRNA formyltransferase